MSKGIIINLMEINNRLIDASALLDKQINSSIAIALAHTTCAYSKLLSNDTRNSHYDSLSISKREISYLKTKKLIVNTLLVFFRAVVSIITNFSKASNLLWRVFT